MGGKIDKFRHSRLQSARAQRKENKKDGIRNDRPEIEMGSVELPVDHHAQRDQTNDYRCGDEPVAQPDASQSFRAGVIFRHGLQNNTPPKVSVDLDVPFVPTGIDRRHIDDKVDAAYRTKYGRYAGSILNSVLTPEARAATLKLVPRTTGS